MTAPNNNILSKDQLEQIRDFLEIAIPKESQICIVRSDLFDQLKDKLGLKIEQYQFERAITDAIRNKLIAGFETRHGRCGGICRVGAFKSKDSAKKIRKKGSCTVTISGTTYRVKLAEVHVFAFIVSVLNGKPINNDKNAVYINNAAYKLPQQLNTADILKNFITTIYKAEVESEPELEESRNGITMGKPLQPRKVSDEFISALQSTGASEDFVRKVQNYKP